MIDPVSALRGFETCFVLRSACDAAGGVSGGMPRTKPVRVRVRVRVREACLVACLEPASAFYCYDCVAKALMVLCVM